MKAVILAAGEGTRLRPKTDDRPKCLVELAGRPLIEWQLTALRAAGIADVTVVTGYRAERVVCEGIRTIRNDRYADTNMVASLMCARECFTGNDDVLIAYGDIVYEPRLVEALLDPAVPVAVAVDTEWRRLWELRMSDPLADAETLRIDPAGRLREIGRKPSAYDDIEAQYVGLIAVRADFAPELVRMYDALDPAGRYEGRTRDQMFMTAFLQHLIDAGTVVGAVRVAGGWVEVDTLDDLAAYESLYQSGELRRYVALAAG